MSRKNQRKTPETSANAGKVYVEDLFAKAVALHAAGKEPEAETYYRVLLSVPPIQAEASYNLGLILHQRRQLAEAIAAYTHAILLRNDYVEAYSNMGTALQALNNYQAAVDIYHKAIVVKPEYAMAYCNLGVALKEVRQSEKAVIAYLRAAHIQPDYDWAYANLSAVLLDLGKEEEAIVAADKAIAIKYELPIAHFNKGSSYKAMARLEEAEQCFRDSIRINADFVEGHFTLAQVLLQQGKFDEGWREYEWRWRLGQYNWWTNIHGEFTRPRWNGEELNGRTVLLYAEQGLGDAMQYVRYVPFVHDRGGKVVLAVHPPLMKLMKCIDGVELIALDQKPLPHFDFYLPLLSLPLLAETRLETIPAKVPYLRAEPDLIARWRARIGGDGLRVGVIWAGNPNQTGDRLRSPRLAAMTPLFQVPGVRFVALQLGAGRDDLMANPLPPNVLDLGPEIADFADTAAIMSGLDLVITSCTAPLHLAGGLGVPTWAVIPFSPHFLWMPGQDGSAWYPSLRLYRQDRAGYDWSCVMSRVSNDLRAVAIAPKTLVVA